MTTTSVRPDPFAPRTSWWIALPREEFVAAVAREQERMTKSKAAKIVGGITVGWGSARRGIR